MIMAKKATNKKDNLPMEEVLWKACDALRGSIEPSEYKHVVLSLIFLKYAGFHFEKRRQEIVNEGLEDFVDNVKEDNRLLGDLSLCSRPHFAALRLLYLTLQATVQVAYLIINIIELQFSPCTFLLPARGIFIPFPGFSRHDTPFTNHFLSSFCLFFVGFPCFLLRKCIAIPLFHYATFCFRISDLLNISVSGNSSKTVRLVIVVCT